MRHIIAVGIMMMSTPIAAQHTVSNAYVGVVQFSHQCVVCPMSSAKWSNAHLLEAHSKMADQMSEEDGARGVYVKDAWYSGQSTLASNRTEEAATEETAPTGAAQDHPANVEPENIEMEEGSRDLAAGETLYENSCRNCHGVKAQGMASFPKLVGFDAAHLEKRLKQYRSGEKIGPNSGLMIPNARELSDEDIANVVAYIVATFN